MTTTIHPDLRAICQSLCADDDDVPLALETGEEFVIPFADLQRVFQAGQRAGPVACHAPPVDLAREAGDLLDELSSYDIGRDAMEKCKRLSGSLRGLASVKARARHVLDDAAALLEEFAGDIRRSHTVGGNWRGEGDARREHDQCQQLADELRVLSRRFSA